MKTQISMAATIAACVVVAMSAWAQGEADATVGTNVLARWASDGYAPAQYAYGISLMNGDGCEKNREAGMAWIRKAVLEAQLYGEV